MKLTVKAKLLADKKQFNALEHTMGMFNHACNFISEIAFNNGEFSRVPLHHLTYKSCRKKFPQLSAQFVIRAINIVSNSYKTDKKILHKFKEHSAIVYDQRLLSFKSLDLISITSTNGRMKIPISIGKYRSIVHNRMRGQADLTLERGIFYLNIIIEIPNSTPIKSKGVLGIDKGIVNIAVTSDGESFSGAKIDKVREKYTKLRKNLQAKGSKSAKRHLKKISKKQHRFQKDINHQISKKIVKIAKDTERAIALENLTGIRSRQTVRKADRQRFGNWGFYQLDSFIKYKAKIEGIPVIYINPRNTSRTCPKCGFVSKSNRKTQSKFSCQSCNFTDNADLVGATNIAFKGLTVNQPIAVHVDSLLTPVIGTASSGL